MNWIRQNLKIVVPAGVAVVGVLAYLAFAVFGVHTLFIDDKVDEAGPLFDSGADATATDAASTDAEPAATEPAAPTPTAATTGAPATDAASPTTEAAREAPAPTIAPEPVVTAPPEPQIITLVNGSFIPRGRYSGEGRALVLNDGSEQRFLRFEEFSTDNGPDLNVYLVNSDANADEGTFDDDFIDLGNLKGNIGDQNYEIPPDVDLEVYDTVVVWCVRFGSAFTAADLMPVA